MGREIKRVPLTFDWPLNKVWEGFINPHYKTCPRAATNECHNGYTNAGKWLDAVSRLLALMGDEAADRPRMAEFQKRGRRYPHPWLEAFELAPRTKIAAKDLQRGVRPELLPLDEEMVAFITGLAGQKPSPPFGSSLSYEIFHRLVEVAGLGPDWGICPVCKGDHMDPAVKEVYEAWKPTEPPQGDGWQLWETVSEGSPISPVFDTEEKFVQYLITEGYSESAARNFCKSGWAPSGMFVGGKLYPNIEACADDL